MIRNFLLIAALAIVTKVPVSAAPVLVAEFWHRNVMTVLAPSPPPATVPYGFDAFDRNTSLNFLQWEEDYGTTDVGMTFIAPQNVVDKANQSIALPSSAFILRTGPFSFSDSLYLASPRCGDSCIQILVPDLSRYMVTSVERIIDQLEFSDQPGAGTYIFKGAQRVRYLGELIPEPSAAVLGMIGYCAGIVMRGRRIRTYG